MSAVLCLPACWSVRSSVPWPGSPTGTHHYHQMKLAEQLQDCRTMSTPFGTYKWLVMPMGVKNGNAAFQRLLDDVLKDYRNFSRPFMEDIIVRL